MKIINNQDILLIEELKNTIQDNSNVYLSCNYFTSFALFDLIPILSKVKQIQILLNIQNQDIEEFRFIQSETEHKLNLLLDRPYKVNKVISFVQKKTEIRKGSLGNQNIIIVENNNVSTCFSLTPMDLDSTCLGLVASKMPVFINNFEDTENQYLKLFNNAWQQSNQSIKQVVVENIQKAASSIPAQKIYKQCVRQIFQYSAITDRADEKLQKVGFKDSKVWDLLYNFQKDAVVGAIEKIETFGGCIIADSVGLGKTFEALAVMKYYQLRNDRILVLAPKKLRENWTLYQLNDKRNILAQDRLSYDVLNHTDLTRERGLSGDINLEMINWGNYDLVVIDESHNFRNNPNKKFGITRYKRLMNDVIKANIKTKVLMLSATPVNNKMNDLKNQIAFITEGKDDAFASYGIDSITNLMRDSQRRFSDWYKTSDPEKLNAKDLMEKLDGGYFKILDMLTIARSRKHIEKYYDTTEIGKFPTRNTPITVTPGIDILNKFNGIEQLYDEISNLNLAAYTPLAYVRSDKREFYEEKYDVQTATGSVFKQVDREQSLIYLMRVNLLKRLESSIFSFRITLGKLIGLIEANILQVEKHYEADHVLDVDIIDIETDDIELEDLLVGGKTKVLLQDMDLIKWQQNLELDKNILSQLLTEIEEINVERDAKIIKLKELIDDKLKNPINKGNKKVIVFTAFADTANYLFNNLHSTLKLKHNINSALVTGSGTNKTNMKTCKSDLNSILLNFAPQSKKRNEIYPDVTDEIDVLFCTDCISEGQNLQDCDYLVNYDIHWNPVRIIQRFGRIDRIGSKNENIQLVNFFPSMELDGFIDLIARVQGKMVMLDVSATGEDNVISKNNKEMQDLDYRKRQLKQLQEQVMDIEDIQGNISITDLSFNDFKIDIEKSSDEELEALNDIPPASFAIVKSNLEDIKKGVLFCLKDNTSIEEQKLKDNIIYPYFLVYVSADGEEIVTAKQTKTALDYFRKLCMGRTRLMNEVIEEFNKETSNSKKMDKYINMLSTAITNIVGVQEEFGLDALASVTGATLLGNAISNEENLELISYLIIK